MPPAPAAVSIPPVPPDSGTAKAFRHHTRELLFRVVFVLAVEVLAFEVLAVESVVRRYTGQSPRCRGAPLGPVMQERFITNTRISRDQDVASELDAGSREEDASQAGAKRCACAVD